jgi:F0F1-type ATP synthase membrane subunit b/b'
LNEKRIQQVLEIEKQAFTIYEAAVKEAEQLPIQAEIEAQALIDQARTSAEAEASQMIAGAQAEKENSQILAEAEGKIKQTEALAASHIDRAVVYVLARTAGKE